MNLVSIFYPIETILKIVFIVICPFNVPNTLLLAFVISVIGLLRVAKMPQFNKEYLARVLMNNHGQNILYVSFGAIGFVNYLYYAPMVLFFLFGVVEFIRLYFPTWRINGMLEVLRVNKWWIYEGKCRLEIFFFIYLLLSLPFDLLGRGLKCFIMGQFLFIKYRINQEFKYSCTMINGWMDEKTKAIGILNKGYKKIAGWIYDYANRDVTGQQQAHQQQQAQQPQA